MTSIRLLPLLIITILFYSCKKEESDLPLSVNKDNLTVNFDGKFQFEITKGNNVVSFDNLTAASGDPFVGEISGNGLFTAKTIGKTTITFTSGDQTVSSEITVEPYYNLYIEPITDFSLSIDAVKSKETRSLMGQTETALLYEGENNNLFRVSYSFENNRLHSAMAVISAARGEQIVEELATFYAERYQYFGESEGSFFFINKTQTVVAAIGFSESVGLYVLYINPQSAQAINAMKAAGNPGDGPKSEMRSEIVASMRRISVQLSGE